MIDFNNIDYKNILKYQRDFRNDLWGFGRIEPRMTGLSVLLFASNAIEHSDPLRVYIKTTDNILVPYLVTKKGGTVQTFQSCNVPDVELLTLDMYLTMNYELIKDVATEKKDLSDLYYKSIKVITDYCAEDLSEMTKISAELAASIKNRVLWLDEDHTYQGHAPRLKFQHRKNDTVSTHFASIMLTEPYTIFNLKGSDLTKEELHRIKEFVKANGTNLISVAKGVMALDEFKNIMIRVKPDGELLYPTSPYYTIGVPIEGLQIVKERSTDRANLRTLSGEIVLPEWYDEIIPTSSIKDRGKYFIGLLNGVMYRIYPNGTRQLYNK